MPPKKKSSSEVNHVNSFGKKMGIPSVPTPPPGPPPQNMKGKRPIPPIVQQQQMLGEDRIQNGVTEAEFESESFKETVMKKASKKGKMSISKSKAPVRNPIMQQFEKAQATTLNLAAEYSENKGESIVPDEENSSHSDLLHEIQNFKKNKLQKIRKAVDDETSEDLFDQDLEPPKPVTLSQAALCFNFWQGDSYPVHKLKFIILQIPARAEVTLNFAGISQLTDIAFAVMSNLRHTEMVRLNGVKAIILDGCYLISNAGLAWMADAFPNLTMLSIVGCNKITNSGLVALSKKCPNMNSLDISGTSVTFLPWPSPEGTKMTNCPILFPMVPADVKLDSAEPLKADSKILCKVSIIKREKAQISLLTAIKGEKPKLSSSSFLEFEPDVHVGDMTATILEFDQSLSNVMVTDQSVVVIMSELKDKNKIQEEVSSISAIILEILGKNPNVHFLLVGCSSDAFGIVPTDVIKEEVENYLKRTADLIKDANYSIGTIDQMPITKQLEYSSARRLQESISKTIISSFEINVDKAEVGKENLKKELSNLAKNIEEFQEINYSEKIYSWAQTFHLQCPTDLQTGVHELHSAAEMIGASSGFTERLRAFGAVHFLVSIGKLCMWINKSGETMVASTPWLFECLNLLLSPCPGEIINNGLDHTIPDDISIWPFEKLQEEVGNRNLNWAQLHNLLSKFPYSWLTTSSSVTTLNKLPDAPLMSTKFFTEFNKRSDEGGIHLVHSFVLNQTVTPAIMQEILMTALQFHIPIHIWKTGVILYDGIVAIMLGQIGYSKVLNLCAYMTSSGDQEDASKLIYNTVEKYKIVIECTLKSFGFSWELLRSVSESISTPPEKICGVLHSHFLKAGQPGPCLHCGISPMQSAVLTSLEMSAEPQFLNVDLVMSPDLKGSVVGSAFEFNGPCDVKVAALLDPFGCRTCSVLLLQGNVRLLKIFFISSSRDSICIDLNSQAIRVTLREDEKVFDISKELGALSLQGETITTKIKGDNPFELEIYLGPKVLQTLLVPFNRYELKISSNEFKNPSNNAMILITGSNFKSSVNSLQVGMRLEAVDRANPHLICAATISDINPETDEVLIHFDEWGNSYDYWTKFDHVDLHPIGYMDCRGVSLSETRELRPELQPPRGHRRPFEWIAYLKDINAEPVPFELFSKKQTDGTPPDLIHKAQFELGFNSFKGGSSAPQSCSNNKLTAHGLEFGAKQYLSKLEENLQLPESNALLEKHKQLFCLLPSPLSVEALRFPLMSSVYSNQNQNLHFLCPGQMLDFHLMNHPGVPINKDELGDLKLWTEPLKLANALLLLQKHTLPNKISSLCAGAENLQSVKMHQLEMAFKRLHRLYLMHLLFYNRSEELSVEQIDTIEKLLENSQKSDLAGFAKLFSYIPGQSGLFCSAHKLANSPASGIHDFSVEKFHGLSSNISVIHLEKNPLSELPDEFFSHFHNLTQLWLDGCNIVELPPMQNNTCLEELHIKGNRLQTLLADMKQLTSLKVLDISDNPLELLPQVVCTFESLVELYADNIGTVDLMIVCPLKGLRKLSVAYNYIESIPDTMAELPLTYLDMSGLPFIPKGTSFSLQTLNSFLDKYTVYKRITAKERVEMVENIEANSEKKSNVAKLTELNKILFQNYPRLGNMSKHNELLTIPESIMRITSLETLILPYHALVSVPDSISNLTALEVLIVEYNPLLESVSPELAKLPLKKLHLRECVSLKTPPKEVVRRGFLAVFGYLKRLLQGFVSCKRTKLMMVGLGGAGKTSLVRALTNKQHHFYEDYAEKITDGIDITEWLVDVQNMQINNESSSNEPLHFSVWDFAGQTVYYNTHQFFLSNRAVYLLLWNIRLGFEHAGLDFWLSSIACHAPKAPILVVGTHCDKVQRGKLPMEELKRRFPQISGFHFVSSFSGEGIQDLKTNLITSALAQPYMGEKIPEAFLSLEKQLDNLRKEKSLLKFQEVEDVANTAGIFDNTELIQAVQFLHDLGSVQFFNTPFLKSHVVVVPQWIVDVMACIVTVHEGPIKEGKLYYSDMCNIWEKYPVELHLWLLRLTEEFDLTFPLSDEEANIVPCLLPNTEPKFDFAPVDKDNSERETKIIYKFEYLPAGLFNRAQVRLHQFSDSSVMWKKGFMLKKNNHRALLLQTSNTEVVVTARGYKPENTIFLVHEVFECLIADSYSGVAYDFSIPCADCVAEFTIDPCMFSAAKIKRAFELKAPFLQCDKNFHIISIPEILASLPPDANADFDEHLGRSVRELQELEETVAVRVFYIYTQRNIPDLSSAEKVVNPIHILEDMRTAGHSVSYCDDPDTANMESLTLSIKSAQVIVVAISDEFVASPKCRDLIIFIKQTLHKNLVLVAIGSTLSWQETDINLVLADEVFVKLTQVERYGSKIHELIEAIQTRKQKKKILYPECFISYCWANSKTAVDLGSATKEGALGWGDPRKIKELLQSKGISCWLDVEQMGQEGFFEDIAEGLRKAKVMIACVSDEYANSKNCRMEFRFAVTTLKIPTVLAVVGTGYNWERSEIGLLTVGHSHSCPKINLQYENEAGLLDLFMEVQRLLPSHSQDSSNAEGQASPQQSIAFQEVLELTQRKLLRHITMYAGSMDMESYPRLILIDLKTNSVSERPKTTVPGSREAHQRSKVSDDGADGSDSKSVSSGGDIKERAGADELYRSLPDQTRYDDKTGYDDKSDKYCIRLLCEHEQSWHEAPTSLSFPSKDGSELEDYLKSIAPYVARILAVLKYSKINIPILTTPQGENLRRKLEEWCTKMTHDFQNEYNIILQTVMEEDEQRTYGGLKRCHMPNGKMLWLCEEHEKSSFTLTEEKYKPQLGQREGLKEIYEMEEEEQMLDDSRPTTSLGVKSRSDSPAHDGSPQKGTQDGRPSEEVQQIPVKVVSPNSGQVLPRRPNLTRRQTSSRKTTSQACRLM